MKFAKLDMFEGNPVLALRYEEFPFQPSFPKDVFVHEAGKRGYRNKKRTFAGVPKKATLVSLNHLPQEIVCSVLEGIYAGASLAICILEMPTVTCLLVIGIK